MTPEDDTKKIIDKYGPPAYENGKGQLSKLNENFWAAYYARQREKLIYEPDEREFYDYDPVTGIFTTKSSDSIRTELSALVLEGARAWDTFNGLEQFRSERILAGALAFLRGQVEEREFFTQPHHFVHLGNCTLKFAPGGSDFSVEKFSYAHRSRNRSPINYDPKASCPKFKEHLLSHISEDDRLLLQKYAGQCLLGRNLTQRFVILDGVAGASKGSFVLTINGIIGQKNVYELRTQHLADRFEIGRMIGRTLLVGSDVKGNFLEHPSAYRIKSLVGGDLLEAELKKSNQRFALYGVFNLIVSSNNRLHLRIEGDRSAWERRLLIVRYSASYKGQRIFDIDKYLISIEASGILNWCIDGLKLLYQDYAQAGDIILPGTQKERVDALLSESDSLRQFIRDNIVRTQPTPGKVSDSLTIEEIINDYVDYCVNDKHWVPVPIEYAEKQLPNLMVEFFGITKSHSLVRNGKSKRGFWNIRF